MSENNYSNITTNKILSNFVNKIYGSQGHLKGLTYHLWDHTAQVREAGIAIAKKELISENEVILLDTACIVHDIGNIVGRVGHEERGVEFAKNNLPYLGFNQLEIDQISGMIMATKLPQQPQTLLQKIMADADLSLMGCDNWAQKIDGYRVELDIIDMKKWYEGQKIFLSSHKWWTNGARELYENQKRKNIEWLEDRIANFKS